jgi:hypothetical protein
MVKASKPTVSDGGSSNKERSKVAFYRLAAEGAAPYSDGIQTQEELR